MKLYLCAIVLTMSATAIIVNTCIAYGNPGRAAPANIYQFN
ncbi:MAG: hypothetical protein ACM34A_03015 [Bacillota bacterium]